MLGALKARPETKGGK